MALGYTFSVSGDCYNNGNNGSIQIFASGGIPPYDFVWCCGLGTDTGVTSSVRTGLSGGTYTIVVSDSTALTAETITAGVYVSSGVCVSTINSTDTTCGGDDGTLTVSAATPYTPVNYYLYDGSNNFVVSGDSSTGSRTFFGLSAGTYNVDVFDSGGCSGNTGTCIIKSSTDINYGFYVINNSNCAAGNTGTIYVTGLTGNPPFTYVWSTGAITTSIGGLADGTYTLTITDATGCSKTLPATISTVPTLGIVNFVNVSPTCFQNDGSVTVNISGGTPPYYYQFSNGLNVISYLQSYTISGLFANSYSVNVTDAGLCTTNGITSISVPNSFNSVSISVVNSTCSSLNGSINVNVSSTNGLVYTYTLIDSLGNSTIYSTTSISHSFNGLSGGTYTVTVENPSGCFYSQEVHLFTDNKFTVSSSTTGTTCGSSNGSVTLTASTSGIYTYELSGGYPPIINTSLTSVTFNNLASGIYTATTTDNTGCVQYTTFVINSSSNVGFTLLSTFCGTGNEGTITALITSGNPPFTFDWSPNVGAQTGIYVTGLTAGTYSLTVTDDDGCQQTLTKDVICGTNYVGYELYNVCEGYFVETPSSKLGLLQMLNQGFNDLTVGNIGCILNNAQFILYLYVGPTAYVDIFYNTTSLLDVPSDDLYVTTLTNLLNQVPNLGAIDINLNNNTIKINTDCEKTLEGEEVKIDLKIIYDICCVVPLDCGLSGGTAVIPPPTPTPASCDCYYWNWDLSGSTQGHSPSLSYYDCDGILTVINFPYVGGDNGSICVSGGTTPFYTNVTGATRSNTNVCCDIVACLESLEIVVEFNENYYQLGNSCFGSHICNRAVFDVFANTVNIGTVSLNNGGNSGGGPQYDLLNVPPGYNPLPLNWSSTYNTYNAYPRNDLDRYGLVTMNTAQAISIASFNQSGQVQFSFINVCVNGVNCSSDTGHIGVNWVRIYRNSRLIYNDCPTGNALTITPCAEFSIPTMYISANTLSDVKLIITSYTDIVQVDWGDGSPISNINDYVQTTLTHNYSAPFTGVISVSSLDLSTINELRVFCLDAGINVTISTTEIGKMTSCQLFRAQSNVLVIGDVADLPNSLLTYFDESGDITGDISNLPISITNFVSKGTNTLYGDLSGLTSNIFNFKVLGNNIIDGDIADLPTSLLEVQLDGNNTVYGDIADLPAGLGFLQLDGNNTVYGLIENLPTVSLSYVYIGGNNTVSGDLSLIPIYISTFIVYGNNTITTYSTSRVWVQNFKILDINSASSGFDTSEVNQLLTDLANTPWFPNGTLQIIGTGSPKYTNTTSYNKLALGLSPVNNPVINISIS